MPWFRPALANPDPATGQPMTLDAVRSLIADAVAPSQWFAGPALALRWDHRHEDIRWELYQGRLLDPAHTRLTKQFEAWSIYQVEDGQPSAEPLVSVKLDVQRNAIHVVRGLLCYIWEGHGLGNVIESRETRKWTRELV